MLWIGAGLVAIVAVGIIYNLDAITGQRKFDKLCDSEGGSKFYSHVEPDAGWAVESDDAKAYQEVFNFGRVAFVRFRDKQGASFDAHIKPGPTKWSKAYDISPADSAREVRYRLTIEQGRLPEDQRMSRTRYTITDVRLGSLVASHTYFSYRWTKPERVILSASTSVSCHAGSEVDAFVAAVHNPGRKQ